jgi:hypothetical protein
LVSDLLDQGKTRDAIVFRDYYRESGPDFGERFLEWGQIFLRWGRQELARDFFKKALLLDPSNRKAADGLKKLDDEKN